MWFKSRFAPNVDLQVARACCLAFLAACACGSSLAQIPPILLEACSQMEPASKRSECLRAANQQSVGGTVSPARSGSYASSSQSLVSSESGGARPTSTGATCYVGPRGGTYTITKSGRKNYSGC